MHLEVITPDKTLFEGEVESATFPGSKGSFQVLNNHAPLISSLDRGIVKVVVGGKNEKILINGGIVEVLKNKIILLAEEAAE